MIGKKTMSADEMKAFLDGKTDLHFGPMIEAAFRAGKITAKSKRQWYETFRADFKRGQTLLNSIR